MSATGGANRPPRFLRWVNARLTRGLERGRAPAFMRLLTVRGRVTGEPHTTPVVPVIRDGAVWVVSPYGDVAWVRNVRQAAQLELRRGAERILYEARELDAREAAPVLRAYLTMPSHWVVRRHFDVTKRSSDDAIAAEADRHPVFALTPVP
jgi:deazaflavin-dependent oxidoreductase (nitroreductase family)